MARITDNRIRQTPVRLRRPSNTAVLSVRTQNTDRGIRYVWARFRRKALEEDATILPLSPPRSPRAYEKSPTSSVGQLGAPRPIRLDAAVRQRRAVVKTVRRQHRQHRTAAAAQELRRQQRRRMLMLAADKMLLLLLQQMLLLLLLMMRLNRRSAGRRRSGHALLLLRLLRR